MNTITNVNTEYIRSSRTIETVRVSNGKLEKLLFVFNYEGCSFRVFSNLLDLISFFEKGTEPTHHFETDDELDEFLIHSVKI